MCECATDDMLTHMRTTILLPDALYRDTKAAASSSGRTVTSLIEEALRARPEAPPPGPAAGLSREEGGAARGRPRGFRRTPRRHGRPGVILPDVNVLVCAFRADAESHSAVKR